MFLSFDLFQLFVFYEIAIIPKSINNGYFTAWNKGASKTDSLTVHHFPCRTAIGQVPLPQRGFADR